MESDSLTFHPLDQFAVQSSEWSSQQMMLLWLEASFVIVQLAIVSLVLMAFPLWRLLPRVGLSKWWALAAAFPPAALVLFWIAGMRSPDRKD